MSLVRLEGLVLRTRDLGEADKVATLLTRERGKLQAVARGARRVRSRLLAVSQQFAYAKYLVFLNKRSLHTLSQGELIQPFRRLREDLVCMAHAAYFAELLDVAVYEDEPSEELFEIMISALALLEEGVVTPALVSRWFELRTLDVLGFRPEVDECVGCRAALVPGVKLPARFSVAGGGVLCQACVGEDPAAEFISGAAWQSMRYLRGVPAVKLSTFRLGEAENALLERLLAACIEYRLDKRLNSLAFLQSLVATPGVHE